MAMSVSDIDRSSPMKDEQSTTTAQSDSSIASVGTAVKHMISSTNAGVCYASEIAHDSCISAVSGYETPRGQSKLSADDLIRAVIPQTKRGRIERADAYSKKDDLLCGTIKAKTKFTIQGFSLLACRSEESNVLKPLTTDESLVLEARMRTKMREIAEEWSFRSIARELARTYFTNEAMILYWRESIPAEDGTVATLPGKETLPGILQISALNPADCEWENSQFENQLRWRLPKEITDLIRSWQKERDTRKKAALKEAIDQKKLPAKWIEDVCNGYDHVLLDRSQGHRWIIKTQGPEQNGIPDPTMASIFIHLASRAMLNEGEFGAACQMKHFIQHVKMGESIQSGPQAGSKANWASEGEIKTFDQMINSIQKSIRLTTNHTVSVSFVFPPKDMFDRAKFGSSEKAILEFAEMPEVLMSGDGATNSSGTIAIKRTMTSIEDCRDEISGIFSQFFKSKQVYSSVFEASSPGEMYVTARFDLNVLKDPRVLIDELKLLLSGNAIGPTTCITELNRDPNVAKGEKLSDIEYNKSTGVFDKSFSQSSKNTHDGPPGRPSSPNKEKDEHTLHQSVVTN